MIIMKFRLCKTQLRQLEEEGRQGKWEQTGNMLYICMSACLHATGGQQDRKRQAEPMKK
jgi:hypothetical protein